MATVQAPRAVHGWKDLQRSVLLRQSLVTGAILLLWQMGSGTVLNAYYLSTPAAVVRQIAAWIADGSLWPNLAATLITTAVGFTAAAMVAIPLALLISGSSFLDEVFSPFIFAAYSMPKIVLAPALILWLGIGQAPAIVLSAVTAFFLVFFNLYLGLETIPRIYADTAALMDASPLDTAFKFRLPAAARYLAVGLSQGIIYAFHGTVVGEMTASNTGIGYLIIFAGSKMDSTGVMAGICIVAILAVSMIYVLAAARRFFDWDRGDVDVG